jgi:hypothetical protein
MTDQEIINNVREDDNSENEQESSTPPIIRTIGHDDAMSAFNTAEKNNLQAEDIVILKRLPTNFLKLAFRNKRQKTIETFFL